MESDKALTEAISRVINAKYKFRFPEDPYMSEFDTSIMKTSYLYNILPQRLGNAWEVAATFYGWKKVKKIDLVHDERKIALELKNSVHSDSSAARHRKYQLLVDYKKAHPTIEQLVYAVINDATAKDKMVFDNKIRYVSYTAALRVLFGEDYHKVEAIIQKCVDKFLKDTKMDKVKCQPTPQIILLREEFGKNDNEEMKKSGIMKIDTSCILNNNNF